MRTIFKLITEDTRSQHLSKTRASEKGRERYKKIKRSKVATRTADFNSIDMNKLFKDDILTINIPVRGETDNYIVRISFGGVVKNIKDKLKQGQKLDLRTVIQAVTKEFNENDIYTACSCLHPTTKIKLLDGTTPTIEEMYERFNNGESLYVFSVDENGDFKPGVVEGVFITKQTTDFIKITLDNGEEILTTPDHPYMLRDGTYCNAENLVEGQSLMPLYFRDTTNGYETVKHNSNGTYHSIYKDVANYFKSSEINEAKLRVKPEDNMSYDVAIHHIDFNKKNNNPENLAIMTAREHWDYHNSLCFQNRSEEFKEHSREASRQNAIKRNANPTPAMIEQRKRWHEKGRLRNYDEDRKAQQAEIMKQVREKYLSNLTEEQKAEISARQSKISKEKWAQGCFNTEKWKSAAKQRGENMHTPEMEALATAGVRKYWANLSEEDKKRRVEITLLNLQKATDAVRGSHRSAETLRKQDDTNTLKTLNYMLSQGIDITEENFKKYKLRCTPKLSKHFSSIEELKQYYHIDDNYNHKIIAIERLTLEETPVYDIKVKDFHNFLVDAGVILHNCPDSRFRFRFVNTKNKTNSGEPENRPANITNPHDSLGSSCKHVLAVVNNIKWIIPLSSTIYNYIEYMKKNRENLYADIIYPALYGKKYEGDVQMSFDTELGGEEDTETTSAANVVGKKRGQFSSTRQPDRNRKR